MDYIHRPILSTDKQRVNDAVYTEIIIAYVMD